MTEFDSDLSCYRTFNSFFTRQARPGLRKTEDGIVSPADGIITAGGSFEDGQLFHVKRSNYHLSELLGKPGFNSGSFSTIYLSPADYHRVHAPFNCTITAIRHLHGSVRTVNPAKILRHPNLYCTNERVVIEGDSEYGRFFLVLVGAIVVGRIRISFVDGFTKGFHARNLSVNLVKGQETGLFELGSTVLLIMENNLLNNTETLTGNHIKTGNRLC